MDKNHEINLISLLKEQDPKAIRSIYDDHYFLIKKIVISNNGNSEDAEDLFQETLISLIMNLQKKDFQLSCSLSTYIYSIAHNKWLYHLRQSKRQENLKGSLNPLAEISSDEWMEEEVDDEAKLVAKAMSKLGENCQKLIKAFYYESASLAEIASLLDYTADFVKVKKHRCMKELKKIISENR